LAALLGVAQETPVFSQSEQWLDYKVSDKINTYHWIEVSTNPPANVPLPKTLGKKPYFGRWVTPMDTNGCRWICLDQSQKGGFYNRLYIDNNGNGRLDDKTPITASHSDSSITYDPIRLTLKGDDGPVTYHLKLVVYSYSDENIQMLSSSAGYYSGKVDFGGKKYHIQLIDQNVNGVFNDNNPSVNADKIIVSTTKDEDVFLGRFVEVDKRYFHIEPARDGAFVKVRVADDAVEGTVKVPETITSLSVVGENGQFNRTPVKGEFKIPVGKYKINEWTIARKDSEGANWEITGARPNDSGIFVLTADKPATVQIGEPIRASLEANQSEGRSIRFNILFRGTHGESIYFSKNNSTPKGPKLLLSDSQGTIKYTNTFEFG